MRKTLSTRFAVAFVNPTVLDVVTAYAERRASFTSNSLFQTMKPFLQCLAILHLFLDGVAVEIRAIFFSNSFAREEVSQSRKKIDVGRLATLRAYSIFGIIENDTVKERPPYNAVDFFYESGVFLFYGSKGWVTTGQVTLAP